MIRNKKILSIILATAIVSNMITITPYAMTGEDEIYKVAYDATIKALENKSQKEINEARQAINNIPQNLSWARGEFSKQVDTVQHPILVEIVNAIQIAKKSGNQKDINDARKKIPESLPIQWKGSYSEALDNVQRDLMKKLVDAVEKAKATKNKDDIKIATDLLNILKTVEGNDNVKVWSEKLSQEFQDFVKKIDSSNTNNGGGSSSGGSSISTVYNVSCENNGTTIINNDSLKGAKIVNITGTANGTVKLQDIKVDQININAPQGSIYLSGVTVSDLNVADVAEHSLYIADSTVDNMMVEDKDNNAHIVVGGTNTKIKNAEVKSGASIESETTIDSLVLNNKNSSAPIKLSGDFASSKVSVISLGSLEISAKLDILTFSENLLEAVKVTLDSLTMINKMDIKSERNVQLSASDNKEQTLINAIKVVECNEKNTAIKEIENKVKEDAINKENKQKQIANSFSNYINGTDQEENNYKQEKDNEVLNLLNQYKNEINLPTEFYKSQWSDYEKLEYAASVRTYIKGKTQPLNFGQVQSILEMSKADVRARLESYKFKAHPQNKNFDRYILKVNRDSKNIDITDEVMKATSALNFTTRVNIIGVGQRTGVDFSKNNCFEVTNNYLGQRIILKYVDDSIANEFLNVGIIVSSYNASTSTDLSIHVIVEDSDKNVVINEINKYCNNQDYFNEDAQTRQRKDEEVYSILVKNEKLLNLTEKFINASIDDKRKIAAIYRNSIKWIPKVMMIGEINWGVSQAVDEFNLNKADDLFQGYIVYSGDIDPTKNVYSKLSSVDVKLGQSVGAYKLAYFFKDKSGVELPGIVNGEVLENLNPEVAVLSTDGSITPISEGTAFFKVKVNSVVKTISINVLAKPKPVTLNIDNTVIQVASIWDERTANISLRDQYGNGYTSGMLRILVKDQSGNYVDVNNNLNELHSKIVSMTSLDVNGNAILKVSSSGLKGSDSFRVIFTEQNDDGQSYDLVKDFAVVTVGQGTFTGYEAQTISKLDLVNNTETDYDDRIGTFNIYSKDSNGYRIDKIINNVQVVITNKLNEDVTNNFLVTKPVDINGAFSISVKDDTQKGDYTVTIKVGDYVINTYTLTVVDSAIAPTIVIFNSNTISATEYEEGTNNIKSIVKVVDQFGNAIALEEKDTIVADPDSSVKTNIQTKDGVEVSYDLVVPKVKVSFNDPNKRSAIIELANPCVIHVVK